MLSPNRRPMDDDVSGHDALEAAVRQRSEAQARWQVITPLVASLRRIREENHLAERLRRAIREA